VKYLRGLLATRWKMGKGESDVSRILIARLAKSEKCHNKAKNDGTAAVTVNATEMR